MTIDIKNGNNIALWYIFFIFVFLTSQIKIAIAIPTYYGTNKKSRAFIYTLISGFAETIGAVVAYLFLYRFLSNLLISLILLFVSGIMVSISFNEIFKEVEKYSKKNIVFELKAVDDSSIDFIQRYTINGARKFDCFAVYDNVADGNRFLFFDYESQAAYITPTCFSGFYPIYSSVDFSKMEVLLQNEHSCLKHPSDTLSIDSKVTYVPFNCNNRIIKAIFVPYAQVGKDNKYLTTKDSI